MASRIIGCGGYLPKKILTNDALAQIVDTGDEWIKARTGIRQRHIASAEEFTSHMAIEAAISSIEDAKLNPTEIDLIIVATTTADKSFPGVATMVQYALGLSLVPAFDLQAVCSGFIYGLQVADCMMQSGKYNNVLFICADKMSSLLDWRDRSTCILFGDGAGAVLLQKDSSEHGIIDSKIYAEGSLMETLHTDGGISSTGKSGVVKMKGGEVFKLAVENMASSVESILSVNNINIADIDYLIAHQANLRIINNMAAKFNLPEEKVITTVQNHGNCSAASIPLALAQLKRSGGLKSGDLIAFTAFGAGATWGAALLRW